MDFKVGDKVCRSWMKDDFGDPEDDLEATLRRNNAPIIQANRNDDF